MSVTIKLLREGQHTRRYVNGVDPNRSTLNDSARDYYEVTGIFTGLQRDTIINQIEEALKTAGQGGTDVSIEKYGLPLTAIHVPRKLRADFCIATVIYGRQGSGGFGFGNLRYSWMESQPYTMRMPYFRLTKLSNSPEGPWQWEQHDATIQRSRVNLWLSARIEETDLVGLRTIVTENLGTFTLVDGIPYVIFDAKFRRLRNNEIRGELGLYTTSWVGTTEINRAYELTGGEIGVAPIPQLRWLEDWWFFYTEDPNPQHGNIRMPVIERTKPDFLYPAAQDGLLFGADRWSKND